MSGCGWWINDEQKNHQLDFSGFLKTYIAHWQVKVGILMGNGLLSASPSNGQTFTERSVRDERRQCPETMQSSLIIYSATSQVTHSLFHFLSSCNVPLCSSRWVLRCRCKKKERRRFGFWTVQVRFMLLRMLESGFSFYLIIIGFLHSASVKIHHGFLWGGKSSGCWHAH